MTYWHVQHLSGALPRPLLDSPIPTKYRQSHTDVRHRNHSEDKCLPLSQPPPRRRNLPPRAQHCPLSYATAHYAESFGQGPPQMIRIRIPRRLQLTRTRICRPTAFITRTPGYRIGRKGALLCRGTRARLWGRCT
ncbi:hypothetical protein PLICRDRAFT_87558 [Plicaturopsis crispa FD-325 SS-3]|nr:hypothetical protein PLICRDRAFT_87558 [Plicaturopsis crispa FD-325 SS-3]